MFSFDIIANCSKPEFSRLIKFINNELPNLLKPTYMFNGIPIIQLLAPYVQGFETVRTNIITTTSRLNLFTLGTNIEATIDDNINNQLINAASLPNRIRLMNATVQNGNTVAYDKESEEFNTINLSLSGLHEISEQNADHISAISKIPPSKLFGKPLKGMRSNGDYELTNYYDTIRSYRENMCSAHITTLMHIAMLNIWGEIDENITFRWNNLEAANELEESQIRLNKAGEAATYIDKGVIKPIQVAEKLANDENSGWDSLEIKESDYANAIQVENTNIEKDPLH